MTLDWLFGKLYGGVLKPIVNSPPLCTQSRQNHQHRKPPKNRAGSLPALAGLTTFPPDPGETANNTSTAQAGSKLNNRPHASVSRSGYLSDARASRFSPTANSVRIAECGDRRPSPSDHERTGRLEKRARPLPPDAKPIFLLFARLKLLQAFESLLSEPDSTGHSLQPLIEFHQITIALGEYPPL